MIRINAAVIAATVIAIPALAAPPPGTDLSSDTHRWFERQRSVQGKWCCNVSDGHVLDDDDWRAAGASYEVRVNGTWYPIPPDTLRDTSGGPNPTGRAVGWWTVMPDGAPYFWCFCPGAEY